MIEFPKMLYRDGDSANEYKIVDDAEAEASAREDGFATAGEVAEAVDEKPAARRGRPPKA